MKAIYRQLRITTIEAYNIVKQIDPVVAEKVKQDFLIRRTTDLTAENYLDMIKTEKPFCYKRLVARINQQALQRYFDRDLGLTIEGYAKYLNQAEKLALLVYDNAYNVRMTEKLLSNSLRRAIDHIRDNTNNIEEIALCNSILYKNKFGYTRNDDKNFTINKSGDLTFCPKGKVSIISEDGESWAKQNRISMRYGRALMRIVEDIDYSFPESAVENVVNMLKSEYTFTATFEVVSGANITKYYHWQTYANSNTASLGNSCMRHSSCEDYFEIYEQNCDMLIAKNSQNKIVGRAILWREVILGNGNKVKFMDRIYGNDMTIRAFKSWAMQNGYYHKQFQSYSENFGIVAPDGTNSESNMKTYVVGGPFTFLPYMDTFKYTNDRNDEEFFLNNTEGDFELTNTEGNEDNEDYVTLANGRRCHEEDARYVDMYDEYYHYDDVVWSEYGDCYYLEDEAVETECGMWMLREDAVYLESDRTYRHPDDVVFSDRDDEYILRDYAVECCISGITLHVNDAILLNNKYYSPDVEIPQEA